MLERLLHVHFQHVGDAGFPCSGLRSVSRVKRCPWQTGQVTQTSARKSISSRFEPRPSHASQRPPETLKLKRPGLKPAHLRFGQLGEQIADQVEQFDVRGRVRARRAADRRLVDVDRLVEMLEPRRCVSCVAGKSLSLVQIAVERFPQDVVDERTFARAADPGDADKRLQRNGDVDVAEVVVPGADDFERLLAARPSLLPERRIDNSPERYLPVRLLGSFRKSSSVPSATISPPRTPGPGPKSTMWSASRIVSSSCSTTMTVFPWSRRFLRLSSSSALSRGCRPIDGSSRM